MNLEFMDTITRIAYPLLIAAFLAVPRALGVFIIIPVFTRLGLTGLIRTSVAVAVSLPMIRPLYEALESGPALTTFMIFGLVFKELLIGGMIGIVFGIPFWAADVAGEFVDLQRGSTMAQLIDPSSVGEAGVLATLFSVTIITLFFISGGFDVLLAGYYGTYRLWPPLEFLPVLNGQAGMAVLKILDRIMQIGVLLVAPIVIALLITDIMLAFLSRMSPQLHIFDLSLSVKNLLFSFLIVIYAVFLLPLMLDQIEGLGSAFELLQSFMDSTPPIDGAP